MSFRKALLLPYEVEESDSSSIDRKLWNVSEEANRKSPDNCSMRNIFIYTVADISILNSIKFPNNNLHNLSLRNLNTSLLQLYPEIYTDDLDWLKILINHLECSAENSLRLQGCKFISILLNKSLTEFKMKEKLKLTPLSLVQKFESVSIVKAVSSATTSSNGYLAAARELLITVDSLLRLLDDVDHLVKGSSLCAFGCLLPPHWEVLNHTDPTGCSTNNNIIALLKRSNKHRSNIREAIISKVMSMTLDKIGTVRAAALKALGDLIANRGLNVPTYSMIGEMEIEMLNDNENNIICDLIEHFRMGCSDSKLAVRIQSLWSLGNLLILLLPFRLDYIRHPDKDIQSKQWLSGTFWVSLCRISIELLSDSEKIVATASRSLALLVGGFDLSQTKYGETNEFIGIMNEIVFKFITKIGFNELESIDDKFLDNKCSEVVEHFIAEESQKLVFSISQTFGYVTWCMFHYKYFDAIKLFTNVFDGDYHRVLTIVNIQIDMLKFGKLKLQLFAIQTLLHFVIEMCRLIDCIDINVNKSTNSDLSLAITDIEEVKVIKLGLHTVRYIFIIYMINQFINEL